MDAAGPSPIGANTHRLRASGGEKPASVECAGSASNDRSNIHCSRCCNDLHAFVERWRYWHSKTPVLVFVMGPPKTYCRVRSPLAAPSSSFAVAVDPEQPYKRLLVVRNQSDRLYSFRSTKRSFPPGGVK